MLRCPIAIAGPHHWWIKSVEKKMSAAGIPTDPPELAALPAELHGLGLAYSAERGRDTGRTAQIKLGITSVLEREIER